MTANDFNDYLWLTPLFQQLRGEGEGYVEAALDRPFAPVGLTMPFSVALRVSVSPWWFSGFFHIRKLTLRIQAFTLCLALQAKRPAFRLASLTYPQGEH